jgi:hypothetical protein
MADAPWVSTTHPDQVLLRSKRVQGQIVHPAWYIDLATVGVGG